jgi:hypothetical protein
MSRASDRAYNHIRSMILSGELQPGSQIREEALAKLSPTVKARVLALEEAQVCRLFPLWKIACQPRCHPSIDLFR